jgi:hypothetical protein
VTCWTVNDPSDAQRLVAFGVDALITDDPAGLRAVLAAQLPRGLLWPNLRRPFRTAAVLPR